MVTAGNPTIRLPDFRLPTSSGGVVASTTYMGKTSLALIFTPDLRASARALRRFDDRLVDFGLLHCQALGLANMAAEDVRAYAAARDLTLPILADRHGKVSHELGLDEACLPVVVLADRDMVVHDLVTYPDAHIEGILERVRRIADR